MFLYQILLFTVHGKLLYKNKKFKSYKNDKFKISTPTWKEEFELPNGLSSGSFIQDYFEHIIKKSG